MSLQTDYNESGLKEEAYIRTIWEETELTEDMLAGVDSGYLDRDDIQQAVTAAINEGSATQARKEFYRMLLFDYINQVNGAILDSFCFALGNLEGNEGSKREMLANMFTRILRGELVATEQHRLPVDANAILSQRGINPWKAQLDKLIAIEQDLMH